MVLPGSKVVTVPSVDVVVVVVSVVPVTGCVFVVVDSVVVVLVWANAKGAMAAQARMRMLFFILFPSVVDVSIWFGFPSKPPTDGPEMDCAGQEVRQRSSRRYSSFFLSREPTENVSRVEPFATSANVRTAWLLHPIPPLLQNSSPST